MLFTLFVMHTQNIQAMGVAFAAALIAFVLSLSFERIRKNRTLPTALISVIVALSLLFCHTAHYEKQQAAVFSGEQAEITASLEGLPYSDNGRYYAVLRVHTLNGEKVRFKMRFVSNAPQDFSAHDTIRMTVKPVRLGTADASDGYADFYRAKGLVCGGYAAGEIQKVTQTQTDVYSYILEFRAALCGKITETVSGDAGGVLSAMALGARGILSDNAENNFRAAGISHLLAVSGLHLTTWTMVLFAVLRQCRVRRKIRATAGLCFVLFFAVLTGGAPSVWRAAIMTGTVFAAELFRREADSVNSIGLALFFMLTANPFAARDLSLLLSVSAASGILLFTKPLERAFARLLLHMPNGWAKTTFKAAFSVVAVTCSAGICTLPVQMWAFGVVSLATLPANFLCLTVGSIAMLCGTLGALVSLLHLSVLGQPLLFAASLSANWLLHVTAWFATHFHVLLPVSSNFSKTLLALILLGCAVFLCLRAPRKRFLRGFAAGAAVLFFLCNFTVYFARENRLQMTVCDVGDGTAVVLHLKGETVLMCSGADDFAESEICAILSSYGVTHLDALILPCQTEKDMKLGYAVLQRYPVRTVYYAEALKAETIAPAANAVCIQKSVLRFASGNLTVCVQTHGQYAYGEIFYGDFRALISFCGTNDFHGDCADVLITTKEMVKSVHPADFSLTVFSAETPSAADFWSVLEPNVCTTAENGSISLFAKSDGTFQMTRRG